MATVRKFSANILNHVKAEHAETAFKVSFVNGHWRPPHFSLRRQAELRKACLVQGIDPTSIGMSELAPKKPVRSKPPKGHKQQRTYAEKQAMIQKNLDEMPEKIRKWKEDLAKEKEKNKSSLPF
ncbi:hypothetical protein DL89DRAFT_281312 [Linderina pennispora]|uniref:Large ribosomal subunit protein mL59 domain-containing protein n=1 Tax=Linderina pennispora TaxID=61395 RepID=A0A1Y1WN79_9FUNG|nr:uncharacterized protein DL89DRAFT_281312 [Linderina pennispora]KAJ1948570.1 hypothetical protein EC988_005123 [Linderina pennispora]ORX75010.1 hypothetical protein DL89DRAFT_281312 [Linderina pennispora]